MKFSRQEYQSGLPFLSPGDLPDSGIESISPALAGGFFKTELPGKPSAHFSHSLAPLSMPQFWIGRTMGHNQDGRSEGAFILLGGTRWLKSIKVVKGRLFGKERGKLINWITLVESNAHYVYHNEYLCAQKWTVIC